MSRMTLHRAGRLSRGTGWDEDRLLVDGALGLFAVADASGPTYGGYHDSVGIAPGWAALCGSLRRSDVALGMEDRLSRAFEDAHRTMAALRHERPGGRTHSSASITAVHLGQCATIGQVGTGRCYRLRDGQATLPLADHTQEMPVGWFPTMVLGEPAQGAGKADVESRLLRPGDTFVLCTVGLWHAVDIPRLLESCSGESPEAICNAVINSARGRNTRDQTIQVVRVLTSSRHESA